MPNSYEDIIEQPRPQAPHPMSKAQRAAQFAPFAALTGFQERIAELEQSALNHDLRLRETLELTSSDQPNPLDSNQPAD